MMLNYVKKIKGAAHKAVTLMVDVNRPGIVHQGVSTEVLIVTDHKGRLCFYSCLSICSRAGVGEGV